MEETPDLRCISPPASPGMQPFSLGPPSSESLQAAADILKDGMETDDVELVSVFCGSMEAVKSEREVSRRRLKEWRKQNPDFARVQLRSEKKRARRQERRAAAKLWEPQQPAVALEMEPAARSGLYQGQPAYCWVSKAGFCLRSPLPMVTRLFLHFDCPNSTEKSSYFMILEAPLLPATPMGLSMPARRVLEEPNAGGSSEMSEAWAYEALKLMLQAKLVATEMELQYLHHAFPRLCGGQGRTDFAVKMPHSGEIVGVSVTRAFAFRRSFEVEDAQYLLHKKLGRIQTSTSGCVGRWRWSRQILFIWARSYMDAQTLREVFDGDLTLAAKKSDTLVVVAICPAAHLFKKVAPESNHALDWSFEN